MNKNDKRKKGSISRLIKKVWLEHKLGVFLCCFFVINIEQGGVNVSGGQRQRICIARALLKKPKILILDDSTSAVDTKTDALIRNALKNDLPNTTKIVIAQRTSSVCDADHIIVMENGHIDQIGTHDELLKSNKIYQEVFYTQNKISQQGGKA